MQPILSPLKLLPLALCLALVACASKTQSQIGSAASTPLSDLNIVKADIPEILEKARKQPYLLPTDLGCDAIVLEIRKFDEVLGADLDAPASESDPSLMERGGDAAESAAMGALQSTAEGLIPFRGWVRKLSGAERYSKRVTSAITAGTMRRAFLKGLGASHGCTWTAAPKLADSTAQSATQAQSQAQ